MAATYFEDYYSSFALFPVIHFIGHLQKNMDIEQNWTAPQNILQAISYLMEQV